MSIHAVYQIRSGTGIGVFAPQYSLRRGYFIGLKESTDASVSNCRNPTHDERREYFNDDDFASAPTSGPYNRSGLYLGLNAGDAFDGNATTASGGSVSPSARDSVPGFIAGAQIGANYQSGPVIWVQEARARTEYGLTDHLSARLEYLYHDTGCHRFSDDSDQQSAERQSRSSRTELPLSCRTAGALVNELTYQKGESS